MRGKNNPRNGMKTSATTKKKIGDKTRERCKDNEYIDKLSTSISKFYNTDMGLKRRNEISELRKRENVEFWKRKNHDDPLTTAICKICGDLFRYRGISESGRVTCRKNGCTTKYNNSIGIPRKPLSKKSSISSYKTRLLNGGNKMKLTENYKD